MDKEWIRRWSLKLKNLLEKETAWTDLDKHLYFAIVRNLTIKLHLEEDQLFQMLEPPQTLGENERKRAEILMGVANQLIS